MSDRRQPGLGAFVGLAAPLAILFVGGLTWLKLARDEAALDLRTRHRLRAR